METREMILLKACLVLLEKAYNSGEVLDILSETAFYDNVECDGYCLMDDIKAHLEVAGG